MSRQQSRKADAQTAALRKIRCAIYTRVSSEEGLEQQFNSLQAQREACDAYITSQRHEGWVAIAGRYDDGGFTGGSMERPALMRLLADIEAGLIDTVVVYKVDRLSRSLPDFVKFIECCERYSVAFVSVTQHFKTDTSMGRLVLNVLLSLAQFEREVIGERIRDKIAASKKKGYWMGGVPPLGYDVRDRKLVVNPEEAELVRSIFRGFVSLRSGTLLVKALAAEGRRTKSWTTQDGRQRTGRPFSKGALYKLLHHRGYRGEVVHREQTYKGEHEAIVPRALWDEVHKILAEGHRARGNRTRAKTPAPLRGVIRCAAHGCAMAPTFTRKKGRTYRYYLCTHASAHGYDTCSNPSLAAGEVERAVVDQLRGILASPEVVARAFRAAKSRHHDEVKRLVDERDRLNARLCELRSTARQVLDADSNGVAAALRQIGDEVVEAEQDHAKVCADLGSLTAIALTERDCVAAFRKVDAIWDELFPIEQERIVRLLVEEVRVGPGEMEIQFKSDGIAGLVADLVRLKDREVA